MALFSLRNVSLAFGGPRLLDEASLQIERGERLCLLGRNGEGKSTLLRLIKGEIGIIKSVNVFQSTNHLMRSISPWLTLQRPNFDDLEDVTIRQYKEVYDVFFEETKLIPAGHFHEVGFADLEADPIEQMRGIYAELGLPDFRHAEPKLRGYLGSLKGYQKNVFSVLSEEARERIAREWRRCFEAWGYPV